MNKRKYISAGIAVLAVFLSLSAAYGKSVVKCERSFRWDVKTLSDHAARRINFTPKKTTVDRLREMKVGVSLPDQPRHKPEFSTYEITCEAVSYDLSEDGDITMIITEPGHAGHLMMAEIPDPDCPGVKKSPYRKRFRQVRADFVRLCLKGKRPIPDGKRHSIRGLYRLTGVGFVDVPHLMTGNAPNYMELHPVLKIQKVR